MNKIRINFLKRSDWKNFSKLFKNQLLNDFPAFPSVGKKFFLEEKYKSLKLPEAFLKTKQVILAKKERNLVGFLISHQVPGGVEICDWLWIDKNYRQQGIARRLLRFWETNILRKKKIHKLNISTFNKRNLPFYQKIGFKLEGLRKKDQWGADRYLLGKLIFK
jgi:ribosomal protein S18 acetylase RimI-like enzyme